MDLRHGGGGDLSKAHRFAKKVRIKKNQIVGCPQSLEFGISTDSLSSRPYITFQ